MNRQKVTIGWYVDIKKKELPILKIKAVDDTDMGVDENDDLVFIYTNFLFSTKEEAEKIRSLLGDYRFELIGRISRGLNGF